MPGVATPTSRDDTSAIATGRTDEEGRGVTSDEEEAGSDKVTASTRAFEELDAQIFAGPGRGATRSEAAASDRWGGPSPGTVEAYHRMFDVVVKFQRAQAQRRASMMNTSTR